MQLIRDAIAKLSLGNADQVDEIIGHLKSVKLTKGQFLLKADQICRQYYFIESGSVRLYYYKGDNDYTVWIGTAGQIFTDLDSYLSESKTRINIEALEATTAYVINKKESDALSQKLNPYNTLLRKTVEIAFVSLSRNVISFQSDEAETRYLRVVNEKNWLSQYPLRYISSFIGVTQSSLSRIRAKKG